MSELVKTFVFDLQRFAPTQYLPGADGETELAIPESATAVVPETPTADNVAEGTVYWKSDADGYAYPDGATIFCSVTAKKITKDTEGETLDEPITYYVATKVTEVQVAAAAEFPADLPSTVKLISFGAPDEDTGKSKSGTKAGVELAEAAISGIGDATYTFTGTTAKGDGIAISNGEVTGITWKATDGDAVNSLAVAGADGEPVTINGKAVTMDGDFTYSYNKSGSALIAGGEAAVTEVTAVGDATKLYLQAGLTEENSIEIGGVEYTGAIGANEAVPLDVATTASGYFLLSGNNVSGVVFALPEEAITVPEGTELDLYIKETEDATKLTQITNVPTVTGVDSSTITYTAFAEEGTAASLSVSVAEGATAAVGDVTVEFPTLTVTEDNPPAITFDKTGAITGVIGALVEDDQIVVTGATSEKAGKGGIKFAEAADGIADAIAVEILSGNFTYTVGAENAVKIQLAETTDTVWGNGAATQIAPAAGSGTVTFTKTAYKYTVGEDSEFAYFTAEAIAEAGGKAAATGFNFGAAGDALTLPKDGMSADAETPFALSYGEEATEIAAAPTVDTKGEFTLTFVDATEDEEVFELSDLVAKSAVTANDNVFTFGEVDGGALTFDINGTATGVTVADGGTLNMTANAFSAVTDFDETDAATYFTINGEGVAIEGDPANADAGIVYDSTDKSISGMTGVTVYEAGIVEKIIAGEELAEETFTFDGNADEPTEFTVTTAKKSEAFFTVDGAKATGFQFSKVGDILQGNFSELTLYDEDGSSFSAPKITTVAEPDTVKLAGAITKTKEGFQVNAEANDIVEFADGTKLTFSALDADTAAVVFDNTGALVSISNLTAADDAMIVEGAPGAITIDGAEYEITGAAWTYQINDEEAVTIRDLKSGVKVVNSGVAVELWTAGGENGTFQFGSASAYTVSGADNDTVEGTAGIQFFWDGEAVTGIGSLDEQTSVAGAMDGLTFNENTEALDITDGTYTVFGGGLSLAGLKDGAEVVAAGGVSNFLTDESGQFTILKSGMSIADDADGVTFQVEGGALAGIDSLNGSAIGDFTGGLSVNDVAVAVTNDSVVAVVGDNAGVVEVNQLGVEDATTAIEVTAAGASLFGVDQNGQFVFNGSHSFGVAGNGSEVTAFDFTKEQAAITGVDATETLSGDFSQATSIDGKVLEVAGDSAISIVGGTQILGLTGGASVIQADGISSAVTDGEGEFNFVSGGQSFKVTGGEVEFLLDGKGKVIGISGVDDGEVVTGDLNNIVINGKEPEIIVEHADGSLNTNLYYENGTLSGIVDGDTVVKADNVTTVIASASGTFNFADKEQTFTTTDADGVVFTVVEGTTEVTAVDSLAAGASLEGSIGGLSINGKLVDIQKDDSFGVVGASDGIDGIYNLSDGAIVVDAAGATVASTDAVGTFKFQTSGQSFVVAGDSNIDFALTDNAVTAINGLSEGSVLGSFSGVTGVNGQTFAVADSDNKVEVFADADGKLSKIDKVTADAEIGEVGSVSQVITDKAGKFAFTVGGQSFITGDGADVVTFGLSSSEVVSISDLDGSAIGGFSGIQVNGADIDIVDGDNQLKVFGDGSKLTAIQDVDADATINKAGGVAELVGNISASSGTFNFKDSGEFVVAGDSSVTFALNTAADAEVVGISELSGNVTGSFSGAVSSINGKTFEVVDADGTLTVYGNADASDITKIAGVTGGASIGQVGGVSQILTDKAGEFAFTNGSWSVAGDDEVTFGMSSSKVVSIAELVGTVEGAFEDVTVNGKSFKISGDSSIALVGSASGVTAIEKLSGGAVITKAEGELTAMTDTEGKFTFADGKSLQVLGDSAVVFTLKDGVLTAIDSVDKSVTLVGSLNGIEINGSSSVFDVRDNDNLWYSQGTLSAVVDGNTVVSADGATTVQVATNGTYTFGNGAFKIDGDQDGVAQFTVSYSSIATAINGLDEGATVTGALNGLSINGGEALNVENDDSFGAVAGASALAKLINLSGGANVIAAGGASQFVTDAEGQFTILGTAMEISGDNEVTFTAGTSGITAIDGLEGTATGDFQEVIAVNSNDVQILNDSVVAVSSEGEEVTAIAQVSDGAVVAAVGGATEVSTDTEGNFAFTTGGDSQGFTVEGDDEITFALDDGGVVIGVSEFEEGKLTFDTATTALNVNDEDYLIETTQNASFSIADSSVNYVTGVDGAIDGLVNGTVAATGAMEVNGIDVDVLGDVDYKIVVVESEVVGLADISDGAIVNVANVSIAADTNGEFVIGENTYNFNDSIDNAFTLTTGEEGQLSGVDAFAGEMVIASPADQSLTVNGDALGFTSAADSVTVAASASGINAITGLVNNDAVYGALDNAAIAMEGSTASVRSEGSFLTVNDVTYELLNDADGITVTGGRQVTDLNEEASLFVDQKGKYTVNGNGSDIDVEDTNLPIIGLDGATDAYIYDPEHLIIRRSTPVNTIENPFLGLPTNYPEPAAYPDGFGTEEDPLTKEETDAIFGASSTADLNQPIEMFATNDTKDAQNIPFAGTDFSKKVHLYNGDQNVTFNNAGGNLAVVERETYDGEPTSGVKNIVLGDMGDAVIMRADAGNNSAANIIGGTGDDSVVIQGSAPTTFDMSEGGADKLITFASSNARVSLEGYNALANPNAGIHITERWTADFAAAITNGLLNFANSVMSIGSDPNANAQIDLGTNIVNLFNYLGQKQAVGFTPDAGGLVDASTAQDPVILIGNDKGQKSGNSTLLGGNGDDTAIAGGGDLINLGDGNNVVQLQDDINRAGADIVLGIGRTTINNFNGTFNADHGDEIAVDLANADISFDGTNVIIAGDTFYGVIANAKPDGAISYDSADLAESADETESLVTKAGDYTNVLFNNAGVDVKTAIAKTDGVMDVKLDFDARALNYIGDNSGLTFYDHAGEVLVNLAEGTGSIDTDAALFSGITKVAAGDGQTTIIGGEANETLYAGTGNDSIWGADGDNLLVGHSETGKTGQTSFFVVAEKDGARNTIEGFNFVDDNSWNVNTNQITADKVDIQAQYDRIDTENGGVDVSGNDVVLFVSNRNKAAVESVVIKDAVGKDFVVSGNGVTNDVVAQVNTDKLVADKFANYFVATGKNATLTVGDDIDTHNIYLDNETPLGTDYEGEIPQFYGDIHVIDATGSNAKVELGGNNYDNTILAGTGDSSLWGGNGGNDLLVGGVGINSFFYNYGNGNDTIQGVGAEDVIDLTNILLDDIVDANSAISSDKVELKFTDGGSLTVDSTNGTYLVGLESYVIEDGKWSKKD